MKKILTLTSVFGLSIMAANAGGHTNSMHHNHDMKNKSSAGNTVMMVDEVMTIGSGNNVILYGTVKDMVAEDRYVFTDSTGNIIVEIDETVWPMQSMPDDMVMIYGTMDGSVVDVYSIQAM